RPSPHRYPGGTRTAAGRPLLPRPWLRRRSLRRCGGQGADADLPRTPDGCRGPAEGRDHADGTAGGPTRVREPDRRHAVRARPPALRRSDGGAGAVGRVQIPDLTADASGPSVEVVTAKRTARDEKGGSACIILLG